MLTLGLRVVADADPTLMSRPDLDLTGRQQSVGVAAAFPVRDNTNPVSLNGSL